jgi:hypothetical protein
MCHLATASGCGQSCSAAIRTWDGDANFFGRAPVDRDVAGQLHVQPEVTHKLDL